MGSRAEGIHISAHLREGGLFLLKSELGWKWKWWLSGSSFVCINWKAVARKEEKYIRKQRVDVRTQQVKPSHEFTCCHPCYALGLSLFHKVLPQMDEVRYEKMSLLPAASVTKIFTYHGTHVAAGVFLSSKTLITLSETWHSTTCESLKEPPKFLQMLRGCVLLVTTASGFLFFLRKFSLWVILPFWACCF